jgi:hypothetical protein
MYVQREQVHAYVSTYINTNTKPQSLSLTHTRTHRESCNFLLNSEHCSNDVYIYIYISFLKRFVYIYIYIYIYIYTCRILFLLPQWGHTQDWGQTASCSCWMPISCHMWATCLTRTSGQSPCPNIPWFVNTHVSRHVCVYACIYVCMHTCMNLCEIVATLLFRYLRKKIFCAHAIVNKGIYASCILVFMHACMCTCPRKQVWLHVCWHVYTKTHACSMLVGMHPYAIYVCVWTHHM